MHFSPVVGKTNRAKCDSCGNEYSYSCGSTSNLALHIRTKHPSLANDLPQRKRKSTIIPASTVTASVPEPVSSITPSENENPVDAQTTVTTVSDSRKTYMEANANKQTTMKPFVTRPASVARQKRLTGLLLKMIAVDFQSFSIVEDEGFRAFVNGLDPSFVIPTRHMLSREMLPAKYHQAVEVVKEILGSTVAVTLTTDSWTSVCTQNSWQ